MDISGGKSNLLYDKVKGFQFIDLGIGKNASSDEILSVYKGIRKPAPQSFTTKQALPKSATANWRDYKAPARWPATVIDNSFPANTDAPLPKSLEPYISKRVTGGHEQEVFESAFPPEVQSRMLEERTLYYDPNGNVIPKPSRFLKGGGLFYR